MDKTKIDWCDSTWNPVIGCLHGCEYCYARRFEPTFHKYRLNEYQNKKGRNIFVCSMADLFGGWVPDEWIEEVFKACHNAPQHNYLFLTKNPKRYEEVFNRLFKQYKYMPSNMWFGWSQTGPIENPHVFRTYRSVKMFVSLEPLLRPFKEFHIKDIDWVIVGVETGNRKNKVVPERKLIEDIVNECKKVDIPVFMKSSLADIWDEPLIQEFPEELKQKRKEY